MRDETLLEHFHLQAAATTQHVSLVRSHLRRMENLTDDDALLSFSASLRATVLGPARAAWNHFRRFLENTAAPPYPSEEAIFERRRELMLDDFETLRLQEEFEIVKDALIRGAAPSKLLFTDFRSTRRDELEFKLRADAWILTVPYERKTYSFALRNEELEAWHSLEAKRSAHPWFQPQKRWKGMLYPFLAPYSLPMRS